MTLHPIHQILIVTITMVVVMAALWLLQKRRGDAGIVDVAWSAGLGFAAILYAFTSEGALVRRGLLGLLAGGWSLRLASYLLFDRIFRGEEDGRYQRLRSKWGNKADTYFLVFFQFQALLVPLLSLPLLVVAHNSSPGPTGFDIAGILIFLVAIIGEAIADRQLRRFRSDPGNKGKTCRNGLWRYSRHPNYFFEWFHWWAYVAFGVGSTYAWVTLFGPLIMWVFLFKITGIPATEEQAIASRGDDYRDYQRTTSQFFPWPPKNVDR
jgi:steroid 5-alpha reductase family enzyme